MSGYQQPVLYYQGPITPIGGTVGYTASLSPLNNAFAGNTIPENNGGSGDKEPEDLKKTQVADRVESNVKQYERSPPPQYSIQPSAPEDPETTTREADVKLYYNLLTGWRDAHDQQYIVFGRTTFIAVAICIVACVIGLVVGFYFLGRAFPGAGENTPTQASEQQKHTSPSPTPKHILETASKTTTMATTTTTASRTTTMATTTTTLAPECLTATNLTSSWRTDNTGANIQPGTDATDYEGYKCDLHPGLQWFRFTGAAGNRMLDTCPPSYSCGTRGGYWTDDEMPKEVGVISQIYVYTQQPPYDLDCRYFQPTVLVIRCSWDTEYDFIYKYNKNYIPPCDGAFCGMF